jgi:hypothetical protein
MSYFAGKPEHSDYDYDSTSFGFISTGVIVLTMLISTPMSRWLLTGEPATGGILMTAFIIGLVSSLPTALTAIFNLNHGRPAAIPAVIAFLISYVSAMLIVSALLGQFVMQGSDIIYMGIPAAVLFVWVTYHQNKTAIES